MILVNSRIRPEPWEGLECSIDDDRYARTYYDGADSFVIELMNGQQRKRLGMTREAAFALCASLQAALERW